MATNQALAPSTTPNLSFNLMRVLSIPWLDRAIAGIACIPIVYLVYYRYVHMHHGLPLIAMSLNMLLLILTMIFRRPPKRVTPNALYWLLAFVASYWQIMILTFLQQGHPLVAGWITNSLAAVGLVIVMWARLSLGRNIGFVPAQRELVETGAYAYVRHPVYTSILFAHTAFVLHAYSPLNAVLVGLGAFWFIPVKSLVEEDFLRADPQYAAYMQKVRARWIPFVI
jgi:protein-S-isoprenylcysteine O-methyltransferase Ste14